MTTIWRSIKYPINLFILITLLSGCFQSDYTKLVKSELVKGIRKDSILLGIHFGNTRNEFYGKCFDLNKQHVVTEGAGYSVQYLFTDSLVHPKPTQIRLLFVPAFDDKEILTNMDLEFSYVAWAPWNRHLQSDSLETKIMELLMRWYGGNKFVTANVGESKVPVKLDGNRRVLVYREDPQNVIVRVQDILHPKFKHSINVGVNKASSKN